jgi:hypothetical protein
MKCNIMMTSFVKKTLKKAHSKLVDRLLVKAQILDASIKNQQLENNKLYGGSYSGSQASDYSPSEYTPSTDDGFLPPQRPISGFRVPGYSASNENVNDNMYPRALSMHSSSASYQGTISESQRGGLDPAQGTPNPARERVSWHNLQPNRSPSMQTSELPAYPSKNSYQAPPPGHPYYSAQGQVHPLQMNNPQPTQNVGTNESHSGPNFAELE